MGTRGPIPKRKSELRGHRSKDDLASVTVIPGGRTVTIPDANPDWVPLIQEFWTATLESGQTRFYESSDYMMLKFLCDQMHYYQSRKVRSGQMLASILSGLSGLMLTEGDRRRLQLELERDGDVKEVTTPGMEYTNTWKRSLGS